jgi:hypothetical protein
MILNCIHLHVRVRARAACVVVGMLFLSSIRYCVGECARKKPKLIPLLTPKEPHEQEAGIAACSPPSNYVSYSDRV